MIVSVLDDVRRLRDGFVDRRLPVAEAFEAALKSLDLNGIVRLRVLPDDLDLSM